jgi:hypothetical protein
MYLFYYYFSFVKTSFFFMLYHHYYCTFLFNKFICTYTHTLHIVFIKTFYKLNTSASCLQSESILFWPWWVDDFWHYAERLNDQSFSVFVFSFILIRSSSLSSMALCHSRDYRENHLTFNRLQHKVQKRKNYEIFFPDIIPRGIIAALSACQIHFLYIIMNLVCIHYSTNVSILSYFR